MRSSRHLTLFFASILAEDIFGGVARMIVAISSARQTAIQKFSLQRVLPPGSCESNKP